MKPFGFSNERWKNQHVLSGDALPSRTNDKTSPDSR
jgi:hypothetical protein